MLGPILGSYLTFRCSEGSYHHLHFTRKEMCRETNAPAQGRVAQVPFFSRHHSRSGLDFSRLVFSSAHTTPTLQASGGGIRSAWLLVKGQSSFLRECGFCWAGTGSWAICTFSPAAPDPPLWPGLELPSLRTWVLPRSPELFHPAPLSTHLWAFLELPRPLLLWFGAPSDLYIKNP